MIQQSNNLTRQLVQQSLVLLKQVIEINIKNNNNNIYDNKKTLPYEYIKKMNEVLKDLTEIQDYFIESERLEIPTQIQIFIIIGKFIQSNTEKIKLLELVYNSTGLYQFQKDFLQQQL